MDDIKVLLFIVVGLAKNNMKCILLISIGLGIGIVASAIQDIRVYHNNYVLPKKDWYCLAKTSTIEEPEMVCTNYEKK